MEIDDLYVTRCEYDSLDAFGSVTTQIEVSDFHKKSKKVQMLKPTSTSEIKIQLMTNNNEVDQFYDLGLLLAEDFEGLVNYFEDIEDVNKPVIFNLPDDRSSLAFGLKYLEDWYAYNYGAALFISVDVDNFSHDKDNLQKFYKFLEETLKTANM